MTSFTNLACCSPSDASRKRKSVVEESSLYYGPLCPEEYYESQKASIGTVSSEDVGCESLAHQPFKVSEPKKLRKSDHSRGLPSTSDSCSGLGHKKKKDKKKSKKRKEKHKSKRRVGCDSAECCSDDPKLCASKVSHLFEIEKSRNSVRHEDPGSASAPFVERAVQRRSMAPMTKEEYDRQQSVVRRVVDNETGRSRLVKGDGEILEEIVSYARHKEINKTLSRLSVAQEQGIDARTREICKRKQLECSTCHPERDQSSSVLLVRTTVRPPNESCYGSRGFRNPHPISANILSCDEMQRTK